MTVSAINPYEAPPPAIGSLYGNILDAFFSTLSDAQKQEIWVGFLKTLNLPADTPIGSVPVNLATQQLFYTFIQQLIAQKEMSIIPTATNDQLSPDEIKKRNIMFGVLNSVISMLLSLQNTVTVEAQNLVFFGKWQNAYTDMLTRVPSYVGEESSAVHVDLTNLSNFTFGYNNISVEDIAKWWANNQVTLGTNNNQSFDIGGVSSITTTGNATTVNSVSLNFFNSGISIDTNSTTYTTTNGVTTSQTVGGQVATIAIPTNASLTFDQNVANFKTAFTNFWPQAGGVSSTQSNAYLNSLPTSTQNIDVNSTNFGDQGTLIQSKIFSQSDTVNDPNSIFSLLKPYTYVAPSNVTKTDDARKNVSDAASKARAEINARDQQYIESIRSNRQTVQDAQQQVQANLDQSRQNISQQTDLISSIIDSLKGLIAAIFR